MHDALFNSDQFIFCEAITNERARTKSNKSFSNVPRSQIAGSFHLIVFGNEFVTSFLTGENISFGRQTAMICMQRTLTVDYATISNGSVYQFYCLIFVLDVDIPQFHIQIC